MNKKFNFKIKPFLYTQCSPDNTFNSSRNSAVLASLVTIIALVDDYDCKI